MNVHVQEWTNRDRSGWSSGEWDDEPDKLQWVDPDTDLDCLIVRGPHGAFCGYVGVPAEHPAFGKGYEEVDAEVHGGLTFADRCQESAPEGHGICHIPEPGRTDKIWWLGFDCAHAGDLCPAYDNADSIRGQLGITGDSYKNREFVENEIKQLARQLREIN